MSLLILLQTAALPQVMGAIAGRVSSRDGKPASHARVMAIDASTAESTLVRITQTDESGRFRMENIPPGRYFIGSGRVDHPSYYPGVSELSAATPVTVTGGASIEGIDFLQAAVLRVSGRVIPSDRQPQRDGRGTQIRLWETLGLAHFAPIQEDGTFSFVDVPPGTYAATVNPGINMVPVEVIVRDQDVSGVELRVPATKAVAGRVIVEGSGRVQGVEIRLGPRFSVFVNVNLLNGTFNVTLPEGALPALLSTNVRPAGYTVKAIDYGGIDVLRQPFTITTSDSAELHITVTSSPQQ
jgi:hypothetical protein